MAALSAADRNTIGAVLQSDWSNDRDQFGGITKADIQAAINAADAWADANSASFNSAIPQPARAALTARQKARILNYVLRRRYEVS